MPCSAEIDMHEARARIETEAEKPYLARRGLERHWVVGSHGDVQCYAVEVLRRLVMLRVAAGRA